MQTFLPYDSFSASASVLDMRRLGKQRVECKQICLALSDPSYGWQNHPAVRMWRGSDGALACYAIYVCDEWIRRGYRDSLQPWFVSFIDSASIETFGPPNWIGDEAFHRSHQSNLVRKDPAHYRQHFPDVPNDLPYVWPTPETNAA